MSNSKNMDFYMEKLDDTYSDKNDKNDKNSKKDKNSKNDKIFIHFDSEYLCDNFIKNSKEAKFGHKCCYGTGVHIIKYENKDISSYVQISSIKKMLQTCNDISK